MGVITLMQSTTGGKDWGLIYKELAEHGGLIAAVFLFFIFFFAIAMWNIMTSVFVDKALRLAQPDLESQALEKSMQDLMDCEELCSLVRESDSTGEGLIS